MDGWRRPAIGEARAKLEKAKELLEDAADDADESANEDGIEKAVSRLRSLTDKVAKAEVALLQRGVRVPDASKSTLPTLTPAELMAAVAGRSTMPPDFSKAAAPVESLASRIDRLIDDGTLAGGDADQAQSFLAEFQIAKAGRLPMGHFLHHLATNASSRVCEVFGVEASERTLRMIQ